MYCGEIDFSTSIIEAIQKQDLVVFAGAGVSMGPPACLKDFDTLADALVEASGISRIDAEPPDRYLGRMEHSYPRMRETVGELLDVLTKT